MTTPEKVGRNSFPLNTRKLANTLVLLLGLVVSKAPPLINYS